LGAEPPDLPLPEQLAAHVDIIADARVFSSLWAPIDLPLSVGETWLTKAIAANPSTLFDLYLIGATPTPTALGEWRKALPFQAGYLDRVAVYRRPDPEQGYDRVSPRIWLVRPWVDQIDPHDYAGIADVIWEYCLEANEEPPLAAWEHAGGSGIALRGMAAEAVQNLRETSGLWLWDAG
jgi:hypothetical protein